MNFAFLEHQEVILSTSQVKGVGVGAHGYF